MPNHISETNLALFANGDLALLPQLRVRWHLARCSRCQELTKSFRGDRQAVQMIAGEMPLRVDWDRLSAEMTANIRVGLAAGECVASGTAQTQGQPKLRGSSFANLARSVPAVWRVVAVCVGAGALMTGGWWLNTPAKQTESLERAVRAMAANPFNTSFRRTHVFGGGLLAGGLLGNDDAAFSVGVSTQGIELRENGARLGVTQGNDRPVAVSLNVKGTARARYVDQDTGQVTITSVYAQ